MQSFLIFLFIFLALAGQAFGVGSQSLEQAYSLYKSAAYYDALKMLNSISASAEDMARVEYWKGRSYFKIQEYDLAVKAFQKVKQLGFKVSDLDYQLGQSYYSSQKLSQAFDAFKASEASGYKVGPSLYYQGFINQMLEKYTDAVQVFEAVLRLPSDPELIKQPALLQIAEIYNVRADFIRDPDAKRDYFNESVIPRFEKAIEFDKNTATANQARIRVNEVRNKILKELSKGTMINGVPIAIKPWYLGLSQDVRYDSNVIFQSNTSLLQVSNQGSLFSRTDLQGKYELIIEKTVSSTLDADINNTYYFNRSEPTVFQNDNLSFTPSFRNKVEHFLFDAPATAILDLEYNLFYRDYNSANRLMFYSRFANLVFGERFSVFGSTGSTTLLLNFKWFIHEDPAQVANDPGITLNQNFVLGDQTSLSFNFTFDWNRAVDPTWDRVNYRLNSSIFVGRMLFGLDLIVSLALAVVDTQLQRPARGYEPLYNPSIILSRTFGSGIYFSLSESYTRNDSLDQATYAYTKNMVGLTLGFRM